MAKCNAKFSSKREFTASISAKAKFGIFKDKLKHKTCFGLLLSKTEYSQF